ncbi:hypothetical protein D3C72_2074810 [compost metagenome]
MQLAGGRGQLLLPDLLLEILQIPGADLTPEPRYGGGADLARLCQIILDHERNILDMLRYIIGDPLVTARELSSIKKSVHIQHLLL